MPYEALEDFESPEHGAITKGRILEDLDPATAKAWCQAGLVREIKTKPAPLKGDRGGVDE